MDEAKSKTSLVLNVITVIAFVFYAIGIYLEITLLNNRWGNAEVDLLIQTFGPIMGVIVVVVIGASILAFTYSISKFEAANIFLCWFWIISLYQCAINSFLTVNGLPNEPINLFFKVLFPTFWYPMKEMVFVAISTGLTYFWVEKILKKEVSKLDLIIIVSISLLLIIAIALSQITLINTEL